MNEVANTLFTQRDDVLERARAGDTQAFGALVRMHQKAVYSLALRMLNRRELAEDLAQDVFLELHRRLASIESLDHLGFWLRRVATNRAIDRVRRQGDAVLTDLDSTADLPVAANAEDPLWQRQVERLLQQLQPDARAVLLLRYQEDLDPPEIAEVLSMPLNTVKSHLKRSLAALRVKVLGEERHE
jgi:RNA polymerase sigma-70 factor, ECF subfamily